MRRSGEGEAHAAQALRRSERKTTLGGVHHRRRVGDDEVEIGEARRVHRQHCVDERLDRRRLELARDREYETLEARQRRPGERRCELNGQRIAAEMKLGDRSVLERLHREPTGREYAGDAWAKTQGLVELADGVRGLLDIAPEGGVEDEGLEER